MSPTDQDIKCDVLVTYCWNRVGYNILRSLNALGLNVWVADTSSSNICSISRHVAGSFVYPDPFTREDDFIDTLVAKIDELRPRVLLPTHDEGLIIARHRHRFPSWLIIGADTADNQRRLSDKASAWQVAASAGVPVPRRYTYDDEIKQFPVVFKTVMGNSAKGVYFPATPAELADLKTRHAPSDAMIQEYVAGTDYSVDCVRWDGFFFAGVYKALVTKTPGGGTTTQRITVHYPELTNYARLLLDAASYRGVCGLDFRVDPATGRIAFIECNTRYTGGLATPIAAGFDIPAIHYSLLTTGHYPGTPRFTTGISTKWILGDIITLVGRTLHRNLTAAELRRIFTFRGFAAFDDFRSDDKRAIIGEMRYYLDKLIKNRKLNP